MTLPYGWSADTGTDGVDFDFAVSPLYIGSESFEFKATAVAARIVSDAIEIPVGSVFEVEYVFRRTSGSGSIFSRVQFLDAALNVIDSSSNTIAPIADGVWQTVRKVHSSASHDNRVRFVRFAIGKALATAEQFFLGAQIAFRYLHRSFKAEKTSNQTVATASEPVVSFSQFTDSGEVFDDANDRWDPAADDTGAAHSRKHHANYNSIWRFEARILWSNLVSSEIGRLYIVRNGTVYEASSSFLASGAFAPMQLSADVFMSENDTVDVRASHSAGANRTISATNDAGKANACSFSGWELSP